MILSTVAAVRLGKGANTSRRRGWSGSCDVDDGGGDGRHDMARWKEEIAGMAGRPEMEVWLRMHERLELAYEVVSGLTSSVLP